MGGKQSKRSGSVDITGTPKKGEVENGAAVEGGRLERIEDNDTLPGKVAANGTAPHAETQDTTTPSGDNSPDPIEKKEDDKEEPKTPDTPATTEAAEPETPVSPTTDEGTVSSSGIEEESPNKQDAASPSNKDDKSDKKRKEKTKKKWSFRSISFSKKDKSKPNVAKDENSKNGEVVKEETLKEVLSEVVEIKEETKEAVKDAVEELAKKAEDLLPESVKEEVKEVKELVIDAITKPNEVAEKVQETAEKPVEAVEKPKETVVESPAPAETPAVEKIIEPVQSKPEETKAVELIQSPPPAEIPAHDEEKKIPELPTPTSPASIEKVETVTVKNEESLPVTIEKTVEEISPPQPETPPELPTTPPPPVTPPPVETTLPQTLAAVPEILPPTQTGEEVAPFSPPPVEAPPSTPVQPIPEVSKHFGDDQTLETPSKDLDDDLVGGGGESMAELNNEDSAATQQGDVPHQEADLKAGDNFILPPPPAVPAPMVNGISNDDAAHKIVDDIIEVKTLPADLTVNEVSEAVVDTGLSLSHTDSPAE